MKKLLLSLLLVQGYAMAQVSSSCDVPQQLIDNYHKDIVQLATKRMVDIQSPDTVFVRIPQADYDSVAGGMAAILNATSIPESDSVFNLYCVHNHNGFPGDYAGFLVEVDTNYSWTDAWQSLTSLTGDAYIDTIMTRYHLQVVNFYNWSFGNYAELETDSAWNIIALGDTFEISPGVITAEPNYFIGMAGTIDYTVVGSDRYYDFYMEFSDCFDGCDNYRKWMFKVDSTCAVTYLGFVDWGAFGPQPLPPPVNCNIFTKVPERVQADFLLYPNPVSDKLTVQSSFNSNAELKIYDALGRAVHSQKLNSERTEIDFSSYAHGVYLVQLNAGSSAVSGKFVKD